MASDGAAAPAAEPAAAAPVPEAATAAPAAPEESEPESMFRPIGETAESGTGAGDAEDDGLLEEDSDDELVKSKVMKDITVVPSLCVACEKNGKTSIFMTHIPFFRDVIIMSFRCGECGHRSSEVQEAEMQEKGCRFTVRVETPQDLNRQLIKSNNGVVHIPHIGFEIPKRTQQGVFTTLEGVLMKAAEDLEITLPLYKAQAPEEAVKLEAFMEKLKALVTPEAMPYTVILDDPSGNSFMENPQAPTPDPHLTATYYTRNVEQNHALGLYAENASAGMGDSTAATAGMGDLDDKAAGPPERTEWSIHTGVLSGSQAVSHNTDRATVTHKDARFSRHGALITQATGHAAATVAGREGAAGPASASASYSSSGELQGLIFDSSRESNLKEVMAFPVSCHACAAPGETRMCVTDVPHFREIIIMAFSCEQCGHRDVEVKAGGAIPEKGTVHTLKLTPGEDMAVDLRRDCIKSDSASVEIPELEFEMEHGSLGGMYTTVEGLLGSIEERLRASNRFVLEAGDSAKGAVVPGSAAATEGTAAASPAADDPAGFLAWFDKFLQCKEGAIPFTLIMRDPLSSSYIWSPFDDEETGEKGHDPRLSMEEYTRSAEDDLLLGITDMKTEGYEAPAPAPAPLPVVAEADGDGEEAEATEG